MTPASAVGAVDWTALSRELTPADYHRVAREIESAADVPELASLRVAVLSSHSLQFIRPFFIVEGARSGYLIAPYFGPFGQFEQELSPDDSDLYRFEPDALVLALRPEDVDPNALVRFHASGGERFQTLAGELVDRLVHCVERFRERCDGPVLIANFAGPNHVPFGIFEGNVEPSLTSALESANRLLRERVRGVPNAVVWDYAGLVRSRGEGEWTDPRLWALGRIAVAARHQPALAAHLVRTLNGTLRPPAKCLVLDLDNTLWGGVVGDDGLSGLELGDDYPGSTYKAFQRAVLALMDRGVLLAVVSKNEHDVAEDVFRRHPEMLIRWDDLSAVRINWEPKSKNIREIADELNIGSDAIVLFDDNPVERAEVRANAPEVAVIEVPDQPLSFTAALTGCPHFDQPSLSLEDRQRAQMYGQERVRRTFQERFASVEEFLGSLEMVAQVGEVDATTQARVVQLIGKTNQFNLTTRRHSEAVIAELAQEPASVVAWVRLRDRFGDQGLIGVAILRTAGEEAIIDTFLMSCRVMNRRVEHALMSYLLEHARRLQCARVIGEYIPTKKNRVVERFYADFGFQLVAPTGESRRYVLPLDQDDVSWPEVIRREPPARAQPR